MNPQQTVAVLAIVGIAASFAYTIFDSWRLEIAEAKKQHEENRRHWLLIDRIQQYGYRHQLRTADELIDHILKDAA